LRDINEKSSELAHRIFQCVAVVSRPLRVEELADFLALDFSAGPIPKFREDWRGENPVDAVLSTCSALLSLVDVNGSQVIQFSHFSAKEYLTSTRLSKERDTVSRYHVSMTPAHALVAQACLGILLHLDKNDTIGGLQKFPLAEYAAKHWFEHARFEDVSERVEEGTKKLFDGTKPHLAVWLSIYDPIRGRGMAVDTFGTPLRYAAFCGLPSVVKALAIENPQDVRSLGIDDDDKSTALHLASREGHVDVAHALVEQGADVTAQDTDGSTPLHWASRKGHVDVAHALVEHGADVSAQDTDGSTPMHWASRQGHVDVARALVEHGADVTAQDKLGSTPLHGTSFKGHADFARFLVVGGADVKAQDKLGWTPLHVASFHGHVKLTEFLLINNAHAKTQDEYGSTPLHQLSGSHKGNAELAKLLIERGHADVKARDKDGSTPLHRALVNHRADLAEFLINSDTVKGLEKDDTRLKVQDKDGSTPLHEASANGHTALARLILDNLKDPGKARTVKDKAGRTPLDRVLANSSGHADADLEELLELLKQPASTIAQDPRQIQQLTCTCIIS
jgi:ankyrin repeat protein